LLVEPADRCFRDRAIGIVDEGEAARAAGFPVDRKDNLGRLADARQMLAQLWLRRGVRQVAYEQTD
jgi:hypothetical protein